MNVYEFALCVTITVTLVNTAAGIQCHVCNSGESGDCVEMPDKSAHLEECRSTDVSCMKQSTQMYGRDENGDFIEENLLVTRFCGTENKDRCYKMGGAKSLQVQCSCTDNNCNAATHLTAVGAVVFLAALFGCVMNQ